MLKLWCIGWVKQTKGEIHISYLLCAINSGWLLKWYAAKSHELTNTSLAWNNSHRQQCQTDCHGFPSSCKKSVLGSWITMQPNPPPPSAPLFCANIAVSLVGELMCVPKPRAPKPTSTKTAVNSTNYQWVPMSKCLRAITIVKSTATLMSGGNVKDRAWQDVYCGMHVVFSAKYVTVGHVVTVENVGV